MAAGGTTGSRPALWAFFPFPLQTSWWPSSATLNRLVTDQLHKGCSCSACFPFPFLQDSLRTLLLPPPSGAWPLLPQRGQSHHPVSTPTTNLPEILFLKNNVQEKKIREKAWGEKQHHRACKDYFSDFYH